MLSGKVILLNRMNLAFIHIGKTGGTNIKKKLNKLIKFNPYHCNRSKEYLTDKEQYIIWIRNPIHRFVSSFNYMLTLINIDRDKLTDKQKNNKSVQYMLTIKAITMPQFTPRYKKLINTFGSANKLAESLFSPDPQIARMVKIVMTTEKFNHLKCGIGWYLYNGDFIKEHNDKILFIGRQENMDEDFSNLCKKLDIKYTASKEKINENILARPKDKYLSELAIKNIIEWYKDTDYAALIEMEKHGWITKEVLESYYKY